MVSESYDIVLGDNKEEFKNTYRIFVSAKPDLNSPDNFVATLFYEKLKINGEAERVEIARIDNRSHGDVHFDRLYREDKMKDFSIDWDVHEAAEHLLENWKKYARKFERNKY